MKLIQKNYVGYSIACAVVWAIVLGVIAGSASKASTHALLLVALGWWICWISATLARLVYPPPKKWRGSREAPPKP
jgi:hypothetical protein